MRDYEASKEALKQALFQRGHTEIENFLDYEINHEEDKDVTDKRLDMAIDEMSHRDFWDAVARYC